MDIFINQQDNLHQCLDYISSLETISVDTETEGLDPYTCKLLSLQVGNKDIQYVIDCSKVNILPLKEVLETKLCLLANAKFDWRFLYHKGIDIKNIYDVFLAECILFTGYNFNDRNKPNFIATSLEALALKYCNAQLDKSIRSRINIEGFTERVIKYAADDIVYLEDIREAQLKEIERLGLGKVLELENKVVRVFAKMEYQGVYLNKPKWVEVASKIKEINNDITKKLDSIIVEESKNNRRLIPYTQVQVDLFSEDYRKTIVNWGSSKQKVTILNKLGIPLTSVAEKELQKNKHKHAIIKELLELAKFNKLESSFGMGFLSLLNPVTSRIHSNIWQILSTGRISMSEGNLQQIPAHSELGQVIKSCFTPRKGYKFVSADYSGFELRVIAEFSKDPLWMEIFNTGQDLHSVLCSKTFNIPLEKVKEPFPGKPDISYRFLSKTCHFGLSYGMSKFKLADTAQISVEEADIIIKKFFSVVPEVEKFLNKLAKFGTSNGYIKTDPIFKRIRWFPDLNKSDFKSVGEVERASKNTVPQGVNAIVTKLALCMLQDIIDANDFPVDIVLTVHDEIITECREDFAEEWKVILESTMIEAAKVIIKTVPIEVEGVVSDYWTK